MRTSMKLAGAIATLVLTLALAVPAHAAVASSVTIRWNAANEVFHGRVSSSNSECIAHRTVKVFKKTSSGRQLVGSDSSNRHGRWKVSLMAHAGRYFAKIPKETIMTTHCGADRSSAVHVM